MPLTARHAEHGLLDVSLLLTTGSLGAAIAWEQLHRVRPRAPLSCPECDHGMYAKVSRLGSRFFAHDPGGPGCSLAEESAAHRLLKLELASAIRQAGWHAELEVAGDGWRADVLATSPSGTRRMAWEAQLAPITTSDIKARTRKLEASGVAVCWVTDQPRLFLGHAPAVRLSGSSEPGQGQVHGSRQLLVQDGVAVFQSDWCADRHSCQRTQRPLSVRFTTHPLPCPGHGAWEPTPETMTLAGFVGSVLAGRSGLHRADRTPPPSSAPPCGPLVWATDQDIQAEEAQLAAAAAREHAIRNARQRLVRDVPLREPLTPRTHRPSYVSAVLEEIRRAPSWHNQDLRAERPSPRWGMGIPIRVAGRVSLVISPQHVTKQVRDNLYRVTIVVGDEAERRNLLHRCGPHQQIEVYRPHHG